MKIGAVEGLEAGAREAVQTRHFGIEPDSPIRLLKDRFDGSSGGRFPQVALSHADLDFVWCFLARR